MIVFANAVVALLGQIVSSKPVHKVLMEILVLMGELLLVTS